MGTVLDQRRSNSTMVEFVGWTWAELMPVWSCCERWQLATQQRNLLEGGKLWDDESKCVSCWPNQNLRILFSFVRNVNNATSTLFAPASAPSTTRRLLSKFEQWQFAILYRTNVHTYICMYELIWVAVAWIYVCMYVYIDRCKRTYVCMYGCSLSICWLHVFLYLKLARVAQLACFNTVRLSFEASLGATPPTANIMPGHNQASKNVEARPSQHVKDATGQKGYEVATYIYVLAIRRLSAWVTV